MLKPAIHFSLLFFTFCTAAFAQVSISEHVHSFKYSDKTSSIRSNKPVTAIALKAETFLGDQVELKINNIDYLVPYDPDAPEYTYFISLPEPVTTSEISTSEHIVIYLINSGSSPSIQKEKFRLEQADCEFIVSPIPQSEWRAGLNAPSYRRSFSEVEHAIVHHSAGSNINTDYTQVVRDIYVYHTEVNGWSDIGYNYLVAQNGDLYAGRDPDGGDQDNVIGAHFCGSNSHTMGICLLGNYETAEPTNETWTTLQNLAAFKLHKDDLDPQAYIEHPLGSIGSIAGHQDGCNTACPGENVYVRLTELRNATAETLVNCGDLELLLNFSFDLSTIYVNETVTFTNLSTGYSEYHWVLEGANPALADWKQSGSASYANSGLYSVALIGTLGDVTDTLEVPNAITVTPESFLSFTQDNHTIQSGESIAFVNTSTGYENYTWILEGANPRFTQWKNSGQAVYSLPGHYDVTIIGSKETGMLDTLTVENAVTVEGKPVVYPNPVATSGSFTIASSSNVQQITVYNIEGMETQLIAQQNGSFRIPHLAIGMYILQIELETGNYTERLLIK